MLMTSFRSTVGGREHMKRSFLIPAIAVLMAATAVRADDAPRVAVAVKGQATTTADTVEIEFTVSAHDEESCQAEKKFRKKLGELSAALKEGKPSAKSPKK